MSTKSDLAYAITIIVLGAVPVLVVIWLEFLK